MPSVSGPQHRLMAMIAHDPKVAKRLGIKQNVGRDFVTADKGKKFAEGGIVDLSDDTSWLFDDKAFDDGSNVGQVIKSQQRPKPMKDGGYVKPKTVKIPGHGDVAAEPIPALERASENYMRFAGRPSERNTERYPDFSDERATRIAREYAAMPHAPGDPEVKAAYDRMIEETLAQYGMLKDQGLDFRFIKPGADDPYAASPALGYLDLRNKGMMHVFPTESGFGTLADFDPATNPLLKKVGRIGDLPNATANDAFRIVHDAFGHHGPGNPFFRHKGEERAWLNHQGMYSPEAVPAMTSETRGQNSWLNFGPFGELNRKASGADTTYADQKTGLMKPWTWEDTGYAGGGSVRRLVRNIEYVPKLDELFGEHSRDAANMVRRHAETTGNEGFAAGDQYGHTPMARGDQTGVDLPDWFREFVSRNKQHKTPFFSVHSHPVFSNTHMFDSGTLSPKIGAELTQQGLITGQLMPSYADLKTLSQAGPSLHTMMIEAGGSPNARLAIRPEGPEPHDYLGPSKEMLFSKPFMEYDDDLLRRTSDFNRGNGLAPADASGYSMLVNKRLANNGLPIYVEEGARSAGPGLPMRELGREYEGYLARHNALPFAEGGRT